MRLKTMYFPDAEQLPAPTDPRIVRLRVELYTAAQTLKGNELENFKALIGEIASMVGQDLGEDS